MKSTLLLLDQRKTINEICQIENKSRNTIYNRLIVACLLGILEKNKDNYIFTAFGRNLLLKDDSISSEQFSERQFIMLSDFVKENPFYSQITFSIMSVVDTIFILSKAGYPVKYDIFKDFFIRSLGKDKTWIEGRSQHTGVYHFANYAKELGFIHQIDNNIFLTPCGIQAILIFQLNRSIQLIKARA
ncbi:MAG: hypothetical protein LBG27_02110 [Spirochaetaceae bacterium]|jgi:hypothetical protein|nr:hypothetical protein [Spirochaetaceae bacterium]